MLADVCFGAVIGVAAACVCKKRVAYDSSVAGLVASSAAVQCIVKLHRDSMVLLFAFLHVDSKGCAHSWFVAFSLCLLGAAAARGATVPAASCFK